MPKNNIEEDLAMTKHLRLILGFSMIVFALLGFAFYLGYIFLGPNDDNVAIAVWITSLGLWCFGTYYITSAATGIRFPVKKCVNEILRSIRNGRSVMVVGGATIVVGYFMILFGLLDPTHPVAMYGLGMIAVGVITLCGGYRFNRSRHRQ